MKKIKLLFVVIVFATLNGNAQLSKLHDFSIGLNGRRPHGSLITDGTFLYGMTQLGGTNELGVIFKIKPDGTGYTNIFNFNGANGSQPLGSLIYDGTFFYGMTQMGGLNDSGTVFKIKPDGTSHTVLLNFNGANGSSPHGSLILDSTFLYGLTYSGGTKSLGTLFKIKTDGSRDTVLLNFDGTNGNYPHGDLLINNSFLYGTTFDGGGVVGLGTIFKIKTDGTGYANLLNFPSTGNGYNPKAGFIFDGTFLYGTTSTGGTQGNGTIFKIKPDGTGFSELMVFNGHMSSPSGKLFSDGNFLYGMTYQGNTTDKEIIFKISLGGGSYAILLDFNFASGSHPFGSLISDGTFLYGMTSFGGPLNSGNIFKIKPDGTSYKDLMDFNYSQLLYGAQGSLISDGTFLYGMTQYSDTASHGNAFKIKTDGTNYNNLINFRGANGEYPCGNLLSEGGLLYGMTQYGGSSGLGCIFKIKPDGTNFDSLFSFDSLSGNRPYGSLVSGGNFLYGMTNLGGTNNLGAIFKIKMDGTGYQKILDFNGTNGGAPYGSLFFDGTFLYGMTAGGGGGQYMYGTIFKIKPDGTGYVDLMDFNGLNGFNPHGSLISDGTFLYGMASQGGSRVSCTNGCGVLFKIKPDGTAFDTLMSFNGTNGSIPYGDLVFDGTFLYGMTSWGGINNDGIIFKIKPDGTQDSILFNFDGTNGSNPYGSLFFDGNYLYGMTREGGTYNMGTVFKYQYCTTNCCFSHYITTYDTLKNTFTLTVDAATVNAASSYFWNFGDGFTSTLATPTHTYTIDTIYNVCLKIITASNDTCSYCHIIGKDSQGNIYRTGGFTLNVVNSSSVTPAQTSITNNSSNQNISVYPNPTTGIVYLEGQLENAQIKICDLLSKSIYQNNRASSNLQIDLSSQPNGVYFISIQTNEGSVNKKIVISH